jgi:hypothetical protein
MTIRKRYLLAVPLAGLVVAGAGFVGTAMAGAAPDMSGGTSVVQVGDQIRDRQQDGSCTDCDGTPDQIRDRAKDGTGTATTSTTVASGDRLQTRDQLKDGSCTDCDGTPDQIKDQTRDHLRDGSCQDLSLIHI